MRYRLTGVLLVALLVRAAVPVGFMLAPSSTEIAGVSIVICSSQWGEPMTLDEDGNKKPSGTKTHQSCPYAASALAGVFSPMVPLSRNVEYADVAWTLAKLRFSLTPLPGATSARGPPELV